MARRKSNSRSDKPGKLLQGSLEEVELVRLAYNFVEIESIKKATRRAAKRTRSASRRQQTEQ